MKQGSWPENQKPSVGAICLALENERHSARSKHAAKSALAWVAILMALICITSVFFLPVIQIRGGAMAPILKEGDIVLAPTFLSPDKNRPVAFYSGNKLLVKRVIARPMDYVDIKENGDVSVNGVILNEPWAFQKTKGEIDIELPAQVPDEKYFVLGDNRAVSIDSRYSAVGFISKNDILGYPVFRIWPIDRFGPVS